MPFDGVAAKCAVCEAEKLLLGARVSKIHMPSRDEVIIYVRSMGKDRQLLLSANSVTARMQLTEDRRENPAAPPNFCMVLRKHIGSAKITAIELANYERIITIVFETTTEMGDPTVRRLVVEIMGKHSNIILLNQSGIIIDAIKHIDSTVNTVREILPARPYVLPPVQNKRSPEEPDVKAFVSAWADTPEVTLQNKIIGEIRGISPVLSRELCCRAGQDPNVTYTDFSGETALREVFEKFAALLKAETFQPCVVRGATDRKKIIEYHCIPLIQYGESEPAASVSRAMDLFYTEKDRNDTLNRYKAECTKIVKNALNRSKKKIALQEQILAESVCKDEYKLFGDLLTSNIYKMKQGADSVTLSNYFEEGQPDITIKLDVNLSPQKNAQRYYRLYAKAKSTFNNTTAVLAKSREELEYLEELSFLLEQCDTREAIAEISAELQEQGYMHKRFEKGKRNTGKKASTASAPDKYISSDGYEIYVGKNNRQNDSLTFKIASSNDIWLHTRNIPGSHVVIRKQQGEIPERAIFEAACLAAWHSKAKTSSKVPVEYTQIKYVKKISGGKPGMVIYDNFSTIYVDPSDEHVTATRRR